MPAELGVRDGHVRCCIGTVPVRRRVCARGAAGYLPILFAEAVHERRGLRRGHGLLHGNGHELRDAGVPERRRLCRDGTELHAVDRERVRAALRAAVRDRFRLRDGLHLYARTRELRLHRQRGHGRRQRERQQRHPGSRE